MEHKSQGQMKNQLRIRKDQKPEANPATGGREFGQVIEPMQAQMASGNEGLTDKTATPEKKTPRKGKNAA